MSPLCPHTLAEKLLEGICGSSNLSLNPTHIMSCLGGGSGPQDVLLTSYAFRGAKVSTAGVRPARVAVRQRRSHRTPGRCALLRVRAATRPAAPSIAAAARVMAPGSRLAAPAAKAGMDPETHTAPNNASCAARNSSSPLLCAQLKTWEACAAPMRPAAPRSAAGPRPPRPTRGSAATAGRRAGPRSWAARCRP